jgi:predicted nucleotidyltransferase
MPGTKDIQQMNTELIIGKIIETVPNLIAIYQFGSQATGGTHKDSDIDLAFLAHQPLPPVQRFDLAQEIALIVHKNVDLIDLRATSTVMQMQVISTGACLFSNDHPKREQFEALVYSLYTRLNEERREILKTIRQQGTIYAG